MQSTPSPSADLLGLRAAPPPAAPQALSGAGNLLVDVSSDGPATQPSLGPTPEEAFLRYHPPGALGCLSSVCPQLAPPSLSLCLCPPGCRLSWPTSSGHSGLLAASGHCFVVLSHHRVSACSSFSPSLLRLSLRPSCCLSGIGCLPRLSSLSALGLDGPASWSRLPLRAPWLCWLTQLQLLSKGWPQGVGGQTLVSLGRVQGLGALIRAPVEPSVGTWKGGK